jgi:hypothetical protein
VTRGRRSNSSTSPYTASSAADTSVIAFEWRLTHVIAGATRPNASPTTRNGSPRPSEYAIRRVAPRAVSPWVDATARIEPRIGPMHGVHPSPNAAPATGAAKGPTRSRWGWNRNSWYRRGVVSSCEPARYSAMRSTSAPATRVRASSLRNSTSLTDHVVRKSVTNTTVNPSTNSPVSSAMRGRRLVSPSSSSPSVSPVTRLR